MRCRNCKRPALFRARGKKANRQLHGDNEHDLCARCYRDARNSQKSKQQRSPVIPEFPPLRALLAAYLGEKPS